MKLKGFLWTLTVVIALASAYQISFTYFTSQVEKDAEIEAKSISDRIKDSVETNGLTEIPIGSKMVAWEGEPTYQQLVSYHREDILRSKKDKEIYPVIGHTYQYCKENELNFGLDLVGGMSVTMEVDVPEFVSSLAKGTRSKRWTTAFDAAKKAQSQEEAFVDVFVEEYLKNNSEDDLLKHFSNEDYKEIFGDVSSADQLRKVLKEQVDAALDGAETILEKRVNQFGVAQPNIQQEPLTNRVIIELPGVKDKATVRRRLQSSANLEFYETWDVNKDNILQAIVDGEKALAADLGFVEDVDDLEEALEADASDSTEDADAVPEGTTTYDEDTSATDALFSDLEGEGGQTEAASSTADSAATPSEREFPIRTRLNLQAAGGARVGIVDSEQDTATLNRYFKNPAFLQSIPEDLVLMWGANTIAADDGTPLMQLFAIRKVPGELPQVDGHHIVSSSAETDAAQGDHIVNLVMNDEGTQRWRDMTEANVGKQVAVTMDNIVYSIPVVNEVIPNGSTRISGMESLDEASELSKLLSAGALPARMIIKSEQMVGPTLGAENVRSGFISFAIALGLVLLYMIFYYNRAGIVADVALVVNIFFLFGVLASFKAILTLPGIAGIVLTIGMSVDANVLIFERIREELRSGKGAKEAIKEGYGKAISAILDANITTLLTAIILAIFGTGAIDGFAVTLIVGIFTSLFAAIVITRLIFESSLAKGREPKFSTKLTENAFAKVNYNFLSKRKIWYAVSGLVIAGGIVSLVTQGLSLGVDFTGGRYYVVGLEELPGDPDQIRENIAAEMTYEDGTNANVSVKTVEVEGEVAAIKVITNYLQDVDTVGTEDQVMAALEAGLQKSELKLKPEWNLSSEQIASSISGEKQKASLMAIGFALLGVFLYILIRFRRWQFGLGALLAMAHDVMVVLGLFSILKGVMPFSMEIDQAFIAAILTVVGYSINDTVVVFDRIREYLRINRKSDQRTVINNALNSTLSRTINTSLTTFLVLLIIFLFGGESIKGFVFALMIGVVVGTYSSIFIATPSVVDLTKDLTEKEDEGKEIKAQTA